jgi:hypothetical protein
MQGFASAGGMPLSRLTAASLADLGYVVALNNADSFRLAGSLRDGFFPQTMLDNDVLKLPIYEVDDTGRERPARGAAAVRKP